MSSFRRAIPSSSKDASSSDPSYRIAGVKSWIHNGLGLVSSGNKQLDDLMGGGLALGTSLLIETESYSNYGETLWMYSLCESISVQHDSFLVCSSEREAQRILSLLPYNQTLGGVNEPEGVIPQDKKAELSIAWQYGKYLTKPTDVKKCVASNSTPSSYCSSYDLSKRCQDSILSNGSLYTMCLTSSQLNNPSSGLSESLNSILKEVDSFMKRMKANNARQNVTRIFVPLNDILTYLMDLEEELSPYGGISQHGQAETTRLVARFVLSLKQLVRGKHAVVIFTLHTEASSPHLANKVAQLCETVIAVESFASKVHSVPYEFKEFHGFLLIGKIQQCGMLAPFRPSNSRYGLKRDRRKLHIEPLHLPPEESRAFGSAGTDASLVNKDVAAGAATAAAVSSGSVRIHSNRPSTSGGASGGAVGSHDGHAHDQHGHCLLNAAGSSGGNSSGAAALAAEVEPPAPPRNTKLAASLAAARAARQAAAAGTTAESLDAVSTTATTVASVRIPGPVSISRNVGRSTAQQSALVSGAPLAPGSVCSTNLRSGSSGSGQPNYDF